MYTYMHMYNVMYNGTMYMHVHVHDHKVCVTLEEKMRNPVQRCFWLVGCHQQHMYIHVYTMYVHCICCVEEYMYMYM